MSSPSSGVFGERITQAREARGMSKSTLADLLQVSTTTVANYESDRHSVSWVMLAELSRYLRQPIEFFRTKPLEDALRTDKSRFRSLKVPKQKLAQVESRLTWFHELVNVIERHVELPEVSLPRAPARAGRLLTEDEIESIAETLRALWGLGYEPIEDLTYVAEAHGIVIQRLPLDLAGVDGASKWARGLNRPLILLNSDKANRVRSRFDLAHEIGHLVLHRELDEVFLAEVGERYLESEAHHLASALLLPKDGWSPEALHARTLGDFLHLKPRWHVSVKAMLYRSRDIGLISDESYVRLMKDYSRRRWHRGEPLDEALEPELPSLLQEAISMLAARKNQVRQELLDLDFVDLSGLLGTDEYTQTGPIGVGLRPVRPGAGGPTN